MSAPADEPATSPGPRGPGAVAGHLLGYAELVTALLHAWQRSLGQRIAGAVLAITGLSVCTFLLTIGAIAAAWPTPYRWLVLLGIAGLYLAAGAYGVWLLVRRAAVPEPTSVLLDELRKDAELLSDAWRERRS